LGETIVVLILKRLRLVLCLVCCALALMLVALVAFAGPTLSVQFTGRTRLESLQQGDLVRTHWV
jgi:hypothetical protein